MEKKQALVIKGKQGKSLDTEKIGFLISEHVQSLEKKEKIIAPLKLIGEIPNEKQIQKTKQRAENLASKNLIVFVDQKVERRLRPNPLAVAADDAGRGIDLRAELADGLSVHGHPARSNQFLAFAP